MRPSVEELEGRNVPSTFLPAPYQPFAPGSAPDEIAVPWWGGYTSQVRVPVPPPGTLPVLSTDEWDQFAVLSLAAPVHPTYLQPLPPWFAGQPIVPAGTQDSQWQGDGSYFADMPMPNRWVNIPQDQWLALQHAIYYPDPSQVPPAWQTELAGFQATIQADDQALIAARDAYWAAQPATVQPDPTIADPLAPSGDALIVQALQRQKQ